MSYGQAYLCPISDDEDSVPPVDPTIGDVFDPANNLPVYDPANDLPMDDPGI